jgi:trehalose 6-phosphate phosphatase
VTEVLEDPRLLAASVLREAGGRPLLVASDFDGTLAEITPTPAESRLRDDCRAALEALARRARVAILSGRELSSLTARCGLEGVALAGEHGGDLFLPSNGLHALELDHRARAALDAFELFAARLLGGTGGEVERKRLAVAAHTRQVEEAARPGLEAALLGRARELAKDPSVDAIEGKRVVELRASGATKAHGLARIRALLAPGAHVVAIGDDVTDEDLFREAAREGGSTIKVGAGETVARSRLAGPAEVAVFLLELARTAPSGRNSC